MLAAILIFLGLAPQGANSNPCLLPAWAVSTPQAIACDAKDAPGGMASKNRSGLTFLRSPKAANGMVLYVASRSSGKDAKEAARLIGADGGIVKSDGLAGSQLGTWEAKLSAFGFDPAKTPIDAVAIVTRE